MKRQKVTLIKTVEELRKPFIKYSPDNEDFEVKDFGSEIHISKYATLLFQNHKDCKEVEEHPNNTMEQSVEVC